MGNVLVHPFPSISPRCPPPAAPFPSSPASSDPSVAAAPTANYGITTQGTLVYLVTVRQCRYAGRARSGIVDRSGVPSARSTCRRAGYRNPRVSPDGRQIAVETIAAIGQSSIWVYDAKGGSAIRRLTQDGDTTRPVWSADGKRIAYAANTQKPQGIFWQLADGSGLPERLTTTSDEAHQDYPESFSRDGKVLSFARVRPPLGQDAWSLWTMRLDTTTAPRPSSSICRARTNSDRSSLPMANGSRTPVTRRRKGASRRRSRSICSRIRPPA